MDLSRIAEISGTITIVGGLVFGLAAAQSQCARCARDLLRRPRALTA